MFVGFCCGPYANTCSRICSNYLKDVRHNPNNRTLIGEFIDTVMYKKAYNHFLILKEK